MYLFDSDGIWGAFRMAHVVVGIMWMGLLWFFNFVQVPAFGEMDAGARNNAMDKLSWRALWWFRWAAAATVTFGLLMIGIKPKFYDLEYWFETASGLNLLLGVVMGLVMLTNVWAIIWRNQQVVIANARNVQAGGEADPNVPGVARLAAMASRQNTIFSLPLLVTMVGASHFYNNAHFAIGDAGGTGILYLLIGLAVITVLELNALGMISGTGNGGLNVIYETHKNAMYTGFGLIVFFYLLSEILLRS